VCRNLLRRLAPPLRFVVIISLGLITGLITCLIGLTGLADLVILVTGFMNGIADLVITDFVNGFADFDTGNGFGNGFADLGTAKGKGKGNAADCNIDTIGSDFCLENIK